MSPVSKRSDISPFFAMEMVRFAQAQQDSGRRVLHLEVGQPSAGAPLGARTAAATALLNHSLGYTTAFGTLELRERIARHYLDWYGVEIDPRRVLVVAGASAGFVLAFLAAFDPAQRVGVTEPGYPCYRNTLEALNVTPVGIPIGPETNYRLTPEAVTAAGPLDGLVIASPSNPTGTVLDRTALADIVTMCADQNITLIADEIYHGITFGQSAPSVLEITNDALVLNSFSKYFGMTGWRLGWIVAPERFIDPIERFAQNLYICAPHVSQVAGLAAFECNEELESNVADFATKRTVLLEGLAKAGFTKIAPADGAFYAYVDVSEITDDSMGLCKLWLEELSVAATPGVDFDPVRGHQFVRFSYAGTLTDVEEATHRLAGWMASRKA